jgi:hypothetical protein
MSDLACDEIDPRIALGDELDESVLKANIEKLQPVLDQLKTNPDTNKLLCNSDIGFHFEDFHFRGKLHIIFGNPSRGYEPPLLLSIVYNKDIESFETMCFLQNPYDAQNPYEMLHDTLDGFCNSPGTSDVEKITTYILRIYETLIMYKMFTPVEILTDVRIQFIKYIEMLNDNVV